MGVLTDLLDVQVVDDKAHDDVDDLNHDDDDECRLGGVQVQVDRRVTPQTTRRPRTPDRLQPHELTQNQRNTIQCNQNAVEIQRICTSLIIF